MQMSSGIGAFSFSLLYLSHRDFHFKLKSKDWWNSLALPTIIRSLSLASCYHQIIHIIAIMILFLVEMRYRAEKNIDLTKLATWWSSAFAVLYDSNIGRVPVGVSSPINIFFACFRIASDHLAATEGI